MEWQRTWHGQEVQSQGQQAGPASPLMTDRRDQATSSNHVWAQNGAPSTQDSSVQCLLDIGLSPPPYMEVDEPEEDATEGQVIEWQRNCPSAGTAEQAVQAFLSQLAALPVTINQHFELGQMQIVPVDRPVPFYVPAPTPVHIPVPVQMGQYVWNKYLHMDGMPESCQRIWRDHEGLRDTGHGGASVVTMAR